MGVRAPLPLLLMYRKNYFSGYFFILKEVRDLNEEFIGAIHKETPAHPGRRMAETGQHGKTFCGGVRRRSEQCIPDLGESEGGSGSGTSPQSLAPDTPGI